jgi:MFS transporter, DHA1 family, tetracycline resistance protein
MTRTPLVLIVVTVFLNIMGLGLILPVLPFYATAYGADGTQVGLLFTAFSGLQFLASPVFGALSDRFGRRPVILLGVLGQVVAYLIMGFATSLTMLFVSRVFAGATAGNISATQAFVADVTRPEERTRAYGLVGAAFGAGLLFGPALGGGLTLVDSRAPAFGAAALLALNFLFGLLLLPESLPRERRAPRPLLGQLNPIGVLVPLVRRPALRAPLLSTFLLNVALTGFQANFAVFAATRFGLGPTEVSALFVATGLANILVQLILVPRLSARFADSTLVLVGAAADAAGNLGTAFASVPTALWGALPVMTGGYSLTRGPLTSLVTKLVAPYEQGLANGGVQATISLAGVVGPLGAGLAFHYVDEPSPYWLSALLVGFAAMAILLRARPAPAEAVAPVQVGAPALATMLQRTPAGSATPGPSAAEPERVPILQGSLATLGLLWLLRFLSGAGKSGCVELARNGWHGQVLLEAGQIVGASFGREHGLAALDAVVLVLSDAEFKFMETSSSLADGTDGFALDVEELASRQLTLPDRQRGLAAGISTPLAVPRVVMPVKAQRGDPTEVVLRVGTLQTLLSVDGRRSIQELSDRAVSAEVLVDLAILMDLSLISLDSTTGSTHVGTASGSPEESNVNA